MSRLPIVLGSPDSWHLPAALMAIALALIVWGYFRARAQPGLRLVCALLKVAAMICLAFILLEPLLTHSRPIRGANSFAILADNSQSLTIRDDSESESRGELQKKLLREGTPWQVRLAQDFDVRSYVFDSHIRADEGFSSLDFQGQSSSLGSALNGLARRFQGLPLAGVLLFTDGNGTDLAELEKSEIKLPPIYPVVSLRNSAIRDVGIRNVAVSQTNFESAPVILKAEVSSIGFGDEPVVCAIKDQAGNVVERQQARPTADGRLLSFRFQFRPESEAPGVHFFTVAAYPASDAALVEGGNPAAVSHEQTTQNNERLVVVDQGGGPYRILYVSGRPNWEFKFLRRALFDDEQIHLAGLVRIARRQPRYDFQAKGSSRNLSPFYTGFDNTDEDTAEAANQAVLVRLGMSDDEQELRDGFPRTAEQLYAFHALVIDDLEASFFTQEQLALIRNFVSTRGGGLLMLGGPDSFIDGKYDRTPVGDLLPVYLTSAEPTNAGGDYQLTLTREGLLQPWVRTRGTEEAEARRLETMPTFQTVNSVGRAKPGALTLTEVADAEGKRHPALVSQNFGKGHVAAQTIGDLWRWDMLREKPDESDLARSWRQTARWLVSDVPSRLDVALRASPESPIPAIELDVRVRDEQYLPLDNARVEVEVKRPDGETAHVLAEADDREPGLYHASYVTREPGPYQIDTRALADDNSEIAQRESGWAAQPAADEFNRLVPDREYLQSLAKRTGGELVDAADLDSFVATLPSRNLPLTEQWTTPLWHQPFYFALAIACLAAEWGLRRVNGLP